MSLSHSWVLRRVCMLDPRTAYALLMIAASKDVAAAGVTDVRADAMQDLRLTAQGILKLAFRSLAELARC